MKLDFSKLSQRWKLALGLASAFLAGCAGSGSGPNSGPGPRPAPGQDQRQVDTSKLDSEIKVLLEAFRVSSPHTNSQILVGLYQIAIRHGVSLSEIKNGLMRIENE